MKRSAFFVSDSTGITAEAVGESLLSHFPNIEFERHSLPYIDSENKAQQAARDIDAAALRDGQAPLVFVSLISEPVRAIINAANGFSVDVINAFLAPLEQALGISASENVGRPKVATADPHYSRRIEAINFAQDNDDGSRVHRYSEADIILIGVSRSGKTPTCLYLALQFGIFSANYPITEEDLESMRLPEPLQAHREKLFGLTIDAERLASIRNERLADSRYASLQQCEMEVAEAESLFRRCRIPCIDTTDCSIEEISTRILLETGIQRHFQ